MVKEFEEINAYIEDAIKHRETQKTALEKSRDEKEDIIAQANEEMLTATEKGDLKAFKTAKKTKEEATDAVILFNGRIEHLENEAYISEEEGIELIERIHTLQAEKLNEMIVALKPLLDQIESIGRETSDFIGEGNNLIAKWCNQVKPFRKILGMNNGKPVYQNNVPNFTEFTEYKHYLDYITKMPQYEKITGTAAVDHNKEAKFVIS